MKNIKRYQELFESQIGLTKEQTEWLDECTRGKWTLNPQTGLVDVDGSFTCDYQGLTDFKGVRFGVVTGSFWCYSNELTSLKGAPLEVKGDFDCSENELTSLKDAPQKVGGDFNCGHNELTSLEGAPREVKGHFDCSNNELTSLKDAPQKVDGDFYCSNNELTSLEGAPQKVGMDFYCHGNPVSESALENIYDRMQSGMSWPDAVVAEWDSIESGEDKILLAPYNPNLSQEEIKGYQALARLKRRSI